MSDDFRPHWTSPREDSHDVQWVAGQLGFGDGVTEPAASADYMVGRLNEALLAQHEHDECPVWCDQCGERLASTCCDDCYGGGMTDTDPPTECERCGGVGKIHEGCVGLSYDELVAQRDDALRTIGLAKEYARDGLSGDPEYPLESWHRQNLLDIVDPPDDSPDLRAALQESIRMLKERNQT